MRILFLFILILGSSLNNYSQTTFGIKTGLNLSKAVYLDEVDENLVQAYRKLKPGYVGGFVLNQKVNKVISVQAELLYTQKGLKFEQLPYNMTINSMNYIELPVSGHYKFAGSSQSELNAYIGGYIAYWTDGKYKYTDFNNGIIEMQKVDFNNPDYKFNRIDVGILGGLSFRMSRTSIDMRYTYSMTGSSEFNADALTNRVFSVDFGYLLVK